MAASVPAEGRRRQARNKSPIRPPTKHVAPAEEAKPRSRTSPPKSPASALHSQKLQKVLAQAGLGSRRAMEELIGTGKVKVNGQLATLGMRVDPADSIQVGRRSIQFKVTTRLPRVILYHKPEGEIVSRDDPDGRSSVFEKLPAIRSAKWLAVGRLDYNTSGLLIFTTSGELANRLMHPRFEVEREYAVRIRGTLTAEQMRQLQSGVKLSDGDARFDQLDDQGGEGSNHWYRVILREGRNRMVRRLFEALGFPVSRLMRVRFGVVSLPSHLKRNMCVELKESEIRRLLEWVGSSKPPSAEEAPEPAPKPPPQGRFSRSSKNTRSAPADVFSHRKGRRG